MDVNPSDSGGLTLQLEAAEVRRLEVALQRALFMDVPPHQLGGALDFADRLLKAIGSDGVGGEETA